MNKIVILIENREKAMMDKAKYLANCTMDRVPQEDLENFLNYGMYAGPFVSGVRWADRNPECPWVDAEESLPPVGVPVITYMESFCKGAKPIFRINVFEGDGWRVNVMRYYKVALWMHIPEIPPIQRLKVNK